LSEWPGAQNRAVVATILLAALGVLQPGIDPVFLTLLTLVHRVPPIDHGWFVAASQIGMAIGSLIIWRKGSEITAGQFAGLALGACVAAVATVEIQSVRALLLTRAGYGFFMGMLYAHAMSAASAHRPTNAYGAVFLVQLLLSTILALLLPSVAVLAGPRPALAALCLVPLTAFGLVVWRNRAAAQNGRRSYDPPDSGERHPVPRPAWAMALATLLFIMATMMVWSFTGALAIAAHIDTGVIAEAVAIGSFAGAVTAAMVMRDRPLLSLPVTGLLAAPALLAPMAAAANGDGTLFVAAVILLNIGSTAIIIRSSGAAAAMSLDIVFRRLVVCTHSVGMIAGPVIASAAAYLMGGVGLPVAAVTAVVAGFVALLIGSYGSRTTNMGQRQPGPETQPYLCAPPHG